MEYNIGDLVESISVTHKFPDSEIIFLNTSDILNGDVLHHELSKVHNLPGQAKKSIKKNDILYSEIRPKNKRFTFIDFESENYVVSTKLMVLRVKDCDILLPKFLYYFLSNQKIIDYLQNIAESRSGTFPQITFSELKPMKLTLPTIKQQFKIVQFIDAINKKIRINQDTIANLEELSQTFFKRWFVDFEFPDEEGNPYKSNNGLLIESNVGLIPDKWKIGELKDIAHIVMGQSPKSDTYNNENEGLPLINGATDFNHGIINPTKYTTDPKKVGSQNDYIFGVRATIGRVTELDNEYAIGRGAGIASPINEFCREFLYQILNKAFKDFSNTASGSVYLNVSRNDLISYNIIIPTDDILRAFHSLTNSYLKDVSLLKLENKNLIELRDTLLPKLMSGEIELPDELEVDEHAELLQ